MTFHPTTAVAQTPVNGLYFAPTGLTGATAATRYVGGTTSGAPSSGTFAVGDFVITQAGAICICTVAGSPGTWVQVGGNATPAGFAPGNPTGTASLTLVMMGLGSTCTFTPINTGRVLVNVSGWFLTQTAAANATIGGRFGTGTAPINGAAVSGTRYGPTGDPAGHAVNTANPGGFGITALVTGLTLNTAVWFDIALATSNASDSAVLSNIAMTLVEL